MQFASPDGSGVSNAHSGFFVAVYMHPSSSASSGSMAPSSSFKLLDRRDAVVAHPRASDKYMTVPHVTITKSLH